MQILNHIIKKQTFFLLEYIFLGEEIVVVPKKFRVKLSFKWKSLDYEFELIQINTVTGPHLDSPLCSVLDCPPSVNEKLTSNVNKALVIDYNDSQLISCGSLFQGVCTVRSLRNISKVEKQIKEPVVANNAKASTVAFIAPGPPNAPNTQVQPLVNKFGFNWWPQFRKDLVSFLFQLSDPAQLFVKGIKDSKSIPSYLPWSLLPRELAFYRVW